MAQYMEGVVEHVNFNKALVIATGYFYSPVPSLHGQQKPAYDKNQMIFYWLLKAYSGL